MAEHYVIIALQRNCAVKTPLFQYLVGGPKEELGAQFEVYRCTAVSLL